MSVVGVSVLPVCVAAAIFFACSSHSPIAPFDRGGARLRALTDNEMAVLAGSTQQCALCLDMCSNVSAGNPGACKGSCGPFDWNACHKLYRERSTPDEDIYYCSTKDTAGQIDCDKETYGYIDKTCYGAKWCECHYDYPTYICQVHDEGTWTDKDECDAE